MAQWEFVEWLLFWILETSHFEFEWDSGKRTKNSTKHGISTEEVEAVFRSDLALPLGIQITPLTPEQRALGWLVQQRLIQAAFALREGKARVMSARPAHRKERKQYEEILRKIT